MPAFVNFGLANRGNSPHKRLWSFAKETLDTPELDIWPYALSAQGLITLANKR